MDAAGPQHPDALPRAYAAWRRRTLAAALAASTVGSLAHGQAIDFRVELDGSQSPWVVLGLVAFAADSLGPGVAATGLALAALVRSGRPGPSSRLTRAAWLIWVLGPVPVLLLPASRLFGLEPADALATSASQVRYILTVTAPAFFALLPGALNAALVLERFLPESRASGQIVLVAAPVCTGMYLIPLGLLAQLAFHTELYLGLLLLACSPLVPLAAARRLSHRNTPGEAGRLVRVVGGAQLAVSALGAGLLVGWVGEHPLLSEWVGRIDPAWVLGVAARVLASKWLTTLVVTDLIIVMLHQGREAARALADSPEGTALDRKLDALGGSLRPAPRTAKT